MLKTLAEIFLLLSQSQKKRFLLLQILVFFMAFMEVVGITLLVPFISLITTPEIVSTNTMMSSIYLFSEVAGYSDFVIWFGIVVLLVLCLSTIVSVLTTIVIAKFAAVVGAEISQKLFAYYINESWLFHANESSAKLTKQIATEAQRLTGYILIPIANINARLVMLLMLVTIVVYVDPFVALFGIVLLSGVYGLIYKFVKKRLVKNSKAISDSATVRFGMLNESFSGVKEVILYGRQSFFEQGFNSAVNNMAFSQAENNALSQVPRYLLQFIAFSWMVMLVIYLMAQNQESVEGIVPVLSLYALACFKLLPAFQQIYANVTQMKGNFSAYQSIKDDLSKALYFSKLQNSKGVSSPKALSFRHSLALENVYFKYPLNEKNVLNGLSLEIKARQFVGFVGHSGAGKSTVADMLLGLISPCKGEMKVDGEILQYSQIKSWQRNIGFVPQSIFLSDGSVAENVAFGVAPERIDLSKVNRALELANLSDFVHSLADGVNSNVGERGVRLSGGQRQRIGIARALYNDPDVLVFDEATSALDGITEKAIMDAINGLSGIKTIIMIAHRLKTIQYADMIFFFEGGKIIDSGRFEELTDKNESFKKMAEYS
jgi:HlyD family secretion protein